MVQQCGPDEMAPTRWGDDLGVDDLGPTPVRGTRGHLHLEPSSGEGVQLKAWWQRWNDQPIWTDRLWIAAAVTAAFMAGCVAGRARSEMPAIQVMQDARVAIDSVRSFADVCMAILGRMIGE